MRPVITDGLRAEIARRVAEAPPLREEQRDNLRRLLATAPACGVLPKAA